MVLMRPVGVSVHFPHAFLGSLGKVSGEVDIFFFLLKLRTVSEFTGSSVSFSSVQKHQVANVRIGNSSFFWTSAHF